jgi:hypothetical protein
MREAKKAEVSARPPHVPTIFSSWRRITPRKSSSSPTPEIAAMATIAARSPTPPTPVTVSPPSSATTPVIALNSSTPKASPAAHSRPAPAHGSSVSAERSTQRL